MFTIISTKEKSKLTKLESKVEGLEKEREDLEDEKIKLRGEIAELKSQKKIEEEQIKHLVKIKDERREVEYQKKEMKLKAEGAEAVAKVKDEYQDKLTGQLEKQIADIKDTTAEILKRLPNVNVKMTGTV